MVRVKTFVCHGPLRGECGSLHRSVKSAIECCDRDRRKDRKSDREPTHPDGSDLGTEDAYQVKAWKAARELVR